MADDLAPGRIGDRDLALVDRDERVARVADLEQLLAGRGRALLAVPGERLQLRAGENSACRSSGHWRPSLDGRSTRRDEMLAPMSGIRVRSAFSGRTAWARSLRTPLRDVHAHRDRQRVRPARGDGRGARLGERRRGLLRPRLGDPARVRLGGHGLGPDLREWVNSGLMALFFLVVGLEARREFDLGELRERRRLALPLLAGLGGMVVPVAIFLAFNAGQPSAHGWGVAMSTDTAFALGMLALVGRRLPDRLRAFMLTVVVVDDLVALAVIASAYSGPLDPVPLLGRGRRSSPLILARPRRRHPARPRLRCLLGAAAWVGARASGVDPVVRRPRASGC